MAVPAHKTEYFIIENSNLQKKANTPETYITPAEIVHFDLTFTAIA